MPNKVDITFNIDQPGQAKRQLRALAADMTDILSSAEKTGKNIDTNLVGALGRLSPRTLRQIADEMNGVKSKADLAASSVARLNAAMSGPDRFIRRESSVTSGIAGDRGLVARFDAAAKARQGGGDEEPGGIRSAARDARELEGAAGGATTQLGQLRRALTAVGRVEGGGAGEIALGAAGILALGVGGIGLLAGVALRKITEIRKEAEDSLERIQEVANRGLVGGLKERSKDIEGVQAALERISEMRKLQNQGGAPPDVRGELAKGFFGLSQKDYDEQKKLADEYDKIEANMEKHRGAPFSGAYELAFGASTKQKAAHEMLAIMLPFGDEADAKEWIERAVAPVRIVNRQLQDELTAQSQMIEAAHQRTIFAIAGRRGIPTADERKELADQQLQGELLEKRMQEAGITKLEYSDTKTFKETDELVKARSSFVKSAFGTINSQFKSMAAELSKENPYVRVFEQAQERGQMFDRYVGVLGSSLVSKFKAASDRIMSLELFKLDTERLFRINELTARRNDLIASRPGAAYERARGETVLQGTQSALDLEAQAREIQMGGGMDLGDAARRRVRALYETPGLTGRALAEGIKAATDKLSLSDLAGAGLEQTRRGSLLDLAGFARSDLADKLRTPPAVAAAQENLALMRGLREGTPEFALRNKMLLGTLERIAPEQKPRELAEAEISALAAEIKNQGNQQREAQEQVNQQTKLQVAMVAYLSKLVEQLGPEQLKAAMESIETNLNINLRTDSGTSATMDRVGATAPLPGSYSETGDQSANSGYSSSFINGLAAFAQLPD